MGKRSYTHAQVLPPEIRAMVEAGKTQREIAEHIGFSSKEAKSAAGSKPRPKGRPRKDGRAAHQRENTELERLRMENKLLRDFLQLTGRK